MVVGKAPAPIVSLVKDVTKVEVDETAQLLEQLRGLMYRKEMLEHELNVLHEGATVYVDYCEMTKKDLKDNFHDQEIARVMKMNLHEKEWIARTFVQSYKEAKRQYEHHVIPTIEEICNKIGMDKNDIKFIDLSSHAKELASSEIYGKVTPMPENVEHLAILKDYEEYIALLKADLEMTNKTIAKLKSQDNASVTFNILAFETKRKIMNLEKRYNKRKEYYYEHFLPRYNAEMAECKKLLPKYLARAKELSKLGVDPKLHFLLEEYNAHKNDQEKLWLFYTALKIRVEQIMQFIEDNPDLHEGKMHLAEKIK